jgi:hypothetical protein
MALIRLMALVRRMALTDQGLSPASDRILARLRSGNDGRNG